MNQPHLDDELLSASLDGEASPGAEAHLAACPVCRARIDALDSARQAVSAPPPGPAAGLADRAVAAALEAWTSERTGAVVVPLRPSETARRPRLPGWAVGVAAALAALVAAVPLLTRDGGDGDTQTASAPARLSQAEKSGADEAAVDGGDLGDQSDQLVLGGLLSTAVTGSADADSALSASPTTSGSEGAPAADLGRDSAAVGATTTTAAAGQASPRPALPVTGDRTPPSVPSPCADVVRATFGTGLDGLVYTASLRWQGTPAVLLAYRLSDTSSPGPDHRAFVMARDDCRLLVVQGF